MIKMNHESHNSTLRYYWGFPYTILGNIGIVDNISGSAIGLDLNSSHLLAMGL